MPSAWGNKRERQYEHIRDAYEDKGVKPERAEEIAARTVNKDRRQHGETPNKRSQGTGNPRTGLAERTRDELMNLARQRGVAGRSRMKKAELVAALRT